MRAIESYATYFAADSVIVIVFKTRFSPRLIVNFKIFGVNNINNNFCRKLNQKCRTLRDWNFPPSEVMKATVRLARCDPSQSLNALIEAWGNADGFSRQRLEQGIRSLGFTEKNREREWIPIKLNMVPIVQKSNSSEECSKSNSEFLLIEDPLKDDRILVQLILDFNELDAAVRNTDVPGSPQREKVNKGDYAIIIKNPRGEALNIYSSADVASRRENMESDKFKRLNFENVCKVDNFIISHSLIPLANCPPDGTGEEPRSRPFLSKTEWESKFGDLKPLRHWRFENSKLKVRDLRERKEGEEFTEIHVGCDGSEMQDHIEVGREDFERLRNGGQRDLSCFKTIQTKETMAIVRMVTTGDIENNIDYNKLVRLPNLQMRTKKEGSDSADIKILNNAGEISSLLYFSRTALPEWGWYHPHLGVSNDSGGCQ